MIENKNRYYTPNHRKRTNIRATTKTYGNYNNINGKRKRKSDRFIISWLSGFNKIIVPLQMQRREKKMKWEEIIIILLIVYVVIKENWMTRQWSCDINSINRYRLYWSAKNIILYTRLVACERVSLLLMCTRPIIIESNFIFHFNKYLFLDWWNGINSETIK